MPVEMTVPTIYIDNRPYTIKQEGRNLLDVCLSLGLDLPYFCWHPAMHSVGACRQCAVKLFAGEKDTKGKIVMACMTPAADGVRISISDPEAVKFRSKVIEWLMVNHPHDCPVCDEGGECHLQDMTVMAGHVYRRYRFTKRTHRNQDLGPFLTHEMNRCIQCYRCVRFYRDYAGGRDFDVMGWHDHVYFGRHEDGVLASEFSGNLVEVCPVGVFDDKPLARHYTRKWDLRTAPSVCVHCGLGCTTIPGERYGTLRRVRARFNFNVNGYFLCDRGRYGDEFVNSDRRIRTPLLRQGRGELQPATGQAALERAGQLLKSGKVIGIGSGRASLETNFALRQLVGPGRFYHGMSQRHLRLLRLAAEVLRKGPVPSASLHEAQVSDAVLVLGEDVTNVAPMLALALRQAAIQKPLAQVKDIPRWNDSPVRESIQQQHGPFFVATPDQTKLDELATAAYRAAPEDIARLGLAVAHGIDPAAPAVADLSPPAAALADRIAKGLKEGQRPLVVSGLSCASEAMIEAAANVAWALKKAGLDARLCLTVPECNSMAAAFADGEGIESAVKAVQSGQADTVVIVENDLFRHVAKEQAEALLKAAGRLIVLDHLTGATTAAAEVVLPAATFAEASGTLVNNEGRAQRFFQVFMPQGDIQPSWRWLGAMSASAGKSPSNPWPRLDDLLAAMAQADAAFKEIPWIAPPADFRLVGQRIPRQPHRYSGRTAETADLDVHEPRPPEDIDAPLSFSMEGFEGPTPSALLSRFWAPGWNSVQSINKFQIEVGGPLHGGDSGRRLIEPAASSGAPYFDKAPPAFSPLSGRCLVVPAYHIFGSEELSVLSPGIAQLSPGPYLAMNPADAAGAGLSQGQTAALSLKEGLYRLVVKLHPALPEGVAAVPAGVGELAGLDLPAWGKLEK